MVNNRNEIRANVSIFRACYSQSKLENTKKIQELTSVIKKNPRKPSQNLRTKNAKCFKYTWKVLKERF